MSVLSLRTWCLSHSLHKKEKWPEQSFPSRVHVPQLQLQKESLHKRICTRPHRTIYFTSQMNYEEVEDLKQQVARRFPSEVQLSRPTVRCKFRPTKSLEPGGNKLCSFLSLGSVFVSRDVTLFGCLCLGAPGLKLLKDTKRCLLSAR